MLKRFHQWLPETGLAALTLFFTYRQLGLFPGAWVDEGLFIMTAKMVAAGAGYGIPLLDHVWYYPYFLAVGPTIILPTALSIKILGLSITAARIPMTLFILGSALTTYIFAQKVSDRSAARWATALLITLSAFINTGKPVLGEIPAFFFLILGCFVLTRERHDWKGGLLSGIFFGLSILTKLTFGLILPALILAWIAAAARRQWKEVWTLTISGITGFAVYLPWRIIEAMYTPAGSLTEEINKSLFGTGDLPLLYVLRENFGIFVRLPYLAFGAVLLLGTAGLWSRSVTISRSLRIIFTALIVLFTLYFLNSYGWYRHLVPAHLLLLPFVPAGIITILEKIRRTVATAWLPARSVYGATFLILGVMVLAQGIWQWQYKGSSFGTASAETVDLLESDYRDTDLLIEEAELFAQLPDNPRWLYLIRYGISPSMPELFMTPTPEQRCFRRVKKLSAEESNKLGDTVVRVGNYHILPAPVDCR